MLGLLREKVLYSNRSVGTCQNVPVGTKRKHMGLERHNIKFGKEDFINMKTFSHDTESNILQDVTHPTGTQGNCNNKLLGWFLAAWRKL